MFEKFTDRARRVVVRAREEARTHGHDTIGTGHILLGMLPGGGVGPEALESLGIGLDTVRRGVEEVIGQRQEEPRDTEEIIAASREGRQTRIPFEDESKKVLELSLRESQDLGHDFIGTEHILLGLIREGDGVAAQVLARLGADPDRVREQVVRLLREYRERKGQDQ